MFKTVPATLQMSAFLPCLQEFNKGKNKGEEQRGRTKGKNKGEEQREQGNKDTRKQQFNNDNNTTCQMCFPQ
tara:strand:- start:153 stop:368 length:216 start_codon:yes stop_codon:yes gene_type:complete